MSLPQPWINISEVPGKVLYMNECHLHPFFFQSICRFPNRVIRGDSWSHRCPAEMSRQVWNQMTGVVYSYISTSAGIKDVAVSDLIGPSRIWKWNDWPHTYSWAIWLAEWRWVMSLGFEGLRGVARHKCVWLDEILRRAPLKSQEPTTDCHSSSLLMPCTQSPAEERQPLLSGPSAAPPSSPALCCSPGKQPDTAGVADPAPTDTQIPTTPRYTCRE